MAISTNGGGNGGSGFGSRRRTHHGSLAEINVTPFVDVVLVLLVIFMLTAHVMEFGIEVDVPKTRNVKDSAKEMPVVTITRGGEVTLNGKPVAIDDLAPTIKRQFAGAPGVYVRADKETIWDPIAQVTAELGAAKLQVNMVTQPEDETGKGRR
jgi:biopolymer transport protein ExbD